jgi:hypothetical protein
LELAVGRIRDRGAGIDGVLAGLEGDLSRFGTVSVASGIEVEIEGDSLVVRGSDQPAD